MVLLRHTITGQNDVSLVAVMVFFALIVQLEQRQSPYFGQLAWA